MIRPNTIRIFILTVILISLFDPFQPGSSFVYAQGDYGSTAYEDSVPEGWMVVQGDILIRSVGTESVFDTHFWTNDIIPYEYDDNVDPINKPRMRAAMDEWEAVANVGFVIKTSSHANYIHIQDANVNRAAVGMQGGEQLVEISAWTVHFTIVHELGHTLGLWHEHTRSDRDDYVTIEYDRIEPDMAYNFDFPNGSYDYGPYDFNSVMHYGQCAFSTCANCGLNPANCRTITVNPPWDTDWQSAIGQRTSLSKLDQLTMSMMYSEEDWIFVNKSYALAPPCGSSQFGTFLNPFCDFTTAALVVPTGGTVIIQPGSHSAVGLYTKPMIVRAPLGGVVLGP